MPVLSKLSPSFHTTLEFISTKYWHHLVGSDNKNIKIINRNHLLIASVFGTYWIVKSLWRVFVVPTQLAHIPKVNTLDWLWSILKGESHDIRMKRLVLPLIEKHGLCLKYVMGKWMLTVGDPVLLQTLLKDVETYPKEPAVLSPDLILTNHGSNLGTASYKVWRRQRGVINPAFNRAMPVETFGKIALRMFDNMDSDYKDGQIDMADYARRYALDCLSLGIFNFDMKAVTDRNSPYVTLYKEAFSIVRDPLVYLFPAYTCIPSKCIPYRNRALKANRALRKILLDIIIERQLSIEGGFFDDKEPDLLSMMIMSAKEGHRHGVYMTNGELISNLAVFFIAGHETTASAIASFMYYLAVNQSIQEKARAEVLSVLGDSPEEIIPTDGELKQMEYLDKCIKETMRINPPTSGNLYRTTIKDTTLGNFIVPKDTRVSIELYGVHHLNQYWDQPEVFNPERFDKENKSYRENAIWMPFGYGPRKCIGLNFSITEQRVIQAMLLKRYTWCLVPDSEHQTGLKNAGGGIGLLGPSQLKLQFTRRYITV